MKRILLLFFTCFTYTFSYAQAGASPVQSCSSVIPEICNGSLYPAETSGTATAPFGANLNCGFTSVAENASFYYFVSATNGPLSINVTPTNVIGVPYPNLNGQPDLDFKCWGPFNDLLTMCDQLTNANQEDCSTDPPTTAEVMQITNAVAGQIYVVMIANWAAVGTSPDPCFIQFTASGPNDAFGGPSPGDAGGSAGTTTPLLFCDTDPAINLIDELNGVPLSFGNWTYNGNSIAGTFDPSSDPSGTYTYTIDGTANCPADSAVVIVDIFSASSISITSPSVICSNENPFTLSGIPPAGWSAQGQGIFTDNAGTIISDFDPAIYGIGNHNITYTYTPNGCSSIPVGSSVLVNEAPTVLPSNVTTTNPTCFGYANGTAIITASGGTPTYTPNWFGQDPSLLPSGTFNYTITDINQCTYSSSITLYDPLNTSSTINEFNSSCFGTNNGAASITMLSGSTPPGTTSLLSYCPSNPSPTLSPQPATIIQEVQLLGDNFNISNNTTGIADFYEDYTNNSSLPGEYADVTEGQIYTVSVTPNSLFSAPLDYAPEAINVYIDFNIDGDFADAGEDLGVINIPWGSWIPGTIYPFNFIVPSTGAFGASRMRVVCMSNAGGSAINMGPCESPSGMNLPWFGATEDYSIVLSAPGSSAAFLWANGSTADSIYNIGPGTYTVIITVAGCPIQDTAIITEPEEIMFNPIITGISCNSFTDGSITLNPSGGNSGAYIENWYGQNSLALGNGSYTVTVSDPNTITATNQVACQNDTTIIMIEPTYFSVDFTTSSNVICLNDPTFLEFNFNQGGVAPYTVNYTVNATGQIAGPINSNGANNISVSPTVGNNTYIITSIIDANGCVNQNTIGAQNIYVNALPDVSVSINPNPICVGDTAVLFFNALNGLPPLNLAYNSNGVAGSQTIIGAGTNISVNPNVTTVYELDSVSDANGCINYPAGNANLVVNVIPKMNWNVPGEVCDNDIVYLSFEFLEGTPPWNVIYNINGTDYNLPATYNVLDSVSILPLDGSVYSVVSLTDGNTCKDLLNETLTIVSYPLPEVILSGGGSVCDNGSTTDIIFTINSGVPPYTLNYSAGLISNFVSNIGNIYTFPTNQIGAYTIQDVTDSKGCQAISISGSAYVNINPLPEANITAYPQPANIINPQISFIDLSTDHVNGIWDFDDGDTTLTNFDKLIHTYSDTGTFEVSLVIESDSGCFDIARQTIIISPVFTIYIPNAFTPNNDLNNDFFLPIIDGVSEYEFSVYDRSGQEVFKTNDYSNDYLSCINDTSCTAAWDGKINNGSNYATKGTYVYALVLTDIGGKTRTFEGTVMLIR